MKIEKKTRLHELTDEYLRLEHKLKLGGGFEKIEKIHKQGKLTARERIDLLFDKDEYQQEIGLLIAYDEYKGQVPAAAVVTSIGKIAGCRTFHSFCSPGSMAKQPITSAHIIATRKTIPDAIHCWRPTSTAG